MRERSFWFALFLGLMAMALTACGGGGTDPAVAGNGNTAPTPPEGPDPDPDPQPSALDTQLLAALQGRNVDTPAAPPTPATALVDLGRALFFDKLLSGNRNMACATCHHPTTGSGDDLSVSIGQGGSGLGSARVLANGVLIPRNAPPLFNKGLPSFDQMFWDSRVRRNANGSLVTPEPALNGNNPTASDIASLLDTALAAQSIFPLTSPAEMRGDPGENELADASTNLEVWEALMARLVGTNNGTEGGVSAYRTLFQAAFPGVVDFDAFNIGHVGRALGAYEDLTFRALNSPFDQWLGGDRTAMTDAAKRGAVLFYGRADCFRCHEGPLQTDNRHHAIAVPQVGPGREANGDDLGRFEQTGDPDDVYQFRTPSLRNVELTGPWMHDGAYTSLANAVRHYDNPVRSLQNYNTGQLSALMQPLVDTDATRNQARADALSGVLRPAPNLRGNDVADLVAFLEALTDDASRSMAGEVPASVPSGLPVGE